MKKADAASAGHLVKMLDQARMWQDILSNEKYEFVVFDGFGLTERADWKERFEWDDPLVIPRALAEHIASAITDDLAARLRNLGVEVEDEEAA